MKREASIRILVMALVLTPLALGQSNGSIQRAGRLEPVESHTLYSRLSRPAPVVYVAPEGKVVEKGDLLIELDPAGSLGEHGEVQARLLEAVARREAAEEWLPMAKEEADAKVRLAKQGLDVAKLALEAYVAADHPRQVAEAEAAVSQAEAESVAVAKRLAQLKIAEDNGRTGPGEVGQAEAAKARVEWQVDAAKNRLSLLTGLTHEYRKATLQLALAEREVSLMRARNEATRAVREAEIEIKIAGARVKVQQQRAEFLDRKIDACRLEAPSAGTVQHVRAPAGDTLISVPVERGGIVQPHQPLVQVVDAQRLRLTVPIELEMAQRIETGREVSVHVDAFANESFTGRVVQMRVVPELDPGASLALVVIQVDNKNKQLRPGMTARVELSPRETMGAPVALLSRESGRRCVKHAAKQSIIGL
jgi:multidrug resistance efflux pump